MMQKNNEYNYGHDYMLHLHGGVFCELENYFCTICPCL